MKKIWAASGGSYSDYRVYALFENKKDAEAYVDAAGRDVLWEPPTRANGEIAAMPAYVEEFPLYSGPPEIHLWWQAAWWPRDGEIHAQEHRVQGPEAPKRPLVFMRKEPPFGPMAKRGIRETPVAWGADREACIKSVKDRMAALIAEADHA